MHFILFICYNSSCYADFRWGFCLFVSKTPRWQCELSHDKIWKARKRKRRERGEKEVYKEYLNRIAINLQFWHFIFHISVYSVWKGGSSYRTVSKIYISMWYFPCVFHSLWNFIVTHAIFNYRICSYFPKWINSRGAIPDVSMYWCFM